MKTEQEYLEGYKREIEEQAKKDWEFLDSIRKEKGDAWMDELKEYLEFEECYFSPRIVMNTKGNRQEVDGDLIKEEWVNQTTNGGVSGDDFAGTIYFKLSTNRYLCFNYEM